MTATLDHLVIAAATLDAGVRWCEATLGLTPDAGGAHPQMGTHNRLLNISSPGFERAYLEIIAIDPAATPPLAAGQRRWFDLDDAALQASLARDGAALIHVVARTDDLQACTQALAALPQPIDRGPAVAMHRDAPTGGDAAHAIARSGGNQHIKAGRNRGRVGVECIVDQIKAGFL